MPNKFIGFFLGVVAGGLVGSAAALLFAPTSGENLREGAINRYATVRANVVQAAAERRAELERELQELRVPRKPANVDKEV